MSSPPMLVRGGRPETMAEGRMKIKRMNGKAVLCQADTCEKPALYLFLEKGNASSCTARCEAHAREFAVSCGIPFPPARTVEVNTRAGVSAGSFPNLEWH
jgi:hypothetical protein